MKLPFELRNCQDINVLLRVDLNMPTADGVVLSLSRWQQVLPTIKHIWSQKPKALILLTHYGQPKGYDEAYSVKHLLTYCLHDLPNIEVIDTVAAAQPDSGKIYLCENVRFNANEKSNDDMVAQAYLKQIDHVVFDAFSVGHREHASVCGLIKHAGSVSLGPLFKKELDGIDAAMQQPQPRLAIMGGAKIATKLSILKKMLVWADHVILGGGLANTFLQAKGYALGSSLVDHAGVEEAKALLAKYPDKVILPVDGITQHAQTVEFLDTTHALGDEQAIMDLGPRTVKLINQYIEQAKVVIWNGPLGYYEDDRFKVATQKVAIAVAEADAYSLVGGGDSLAAIENLGLANHINHLSTAGGAFLHYVATGSLPVINCLETRQDVLEETV